MVGTNCLRLSNDASFFSKSFSSNIKNTYSSILTRKRNILEGMGHNISMNIQPVITLIYNGRNGMLVMDKNVVKSVRRLNEIGRLPYDWNGYGAKPFSTMLIDRCQGIVSALTHQPQIYPTGRQSIQFQYELKDRSYLEFEIFENKTMCLCVPKRVYSDAKTMEITDSEEENIKEIVGSFYGSGSTTK